jgi:hypothetical protein
MEGNALVSINRSTRRVFSHPDVERGLFGSPCVRWAEGFGLFERRYATRVFFVVGVPWTKVHGYLRAPLRGGGEGGSVEVELHGGTGIWMCEPGFGDGESRAGLLLGLAIGAGVVAVYGLGRRREASRYGFSDGLRCALRGVDALVRLRAKKPGEGLSSSAIHRNHAFRSQRNFRSASVISTSLMLAKRRCIRPLAANSQFSLP